MIGHLFRIVWNRRKPNALVLVELLLSFLLLCGVFTMGASFLVVWNDPLGFDYHDVWQMRVSSSLFMDSDPEERLALQQRVRDIERAVAGRDDVEFAGFTANAPYGRSSYLRRIPTDSGEQTVLSTPSQIVSLDVLRLEVVAGRWLERGDEASAGDRVVITRDLAMLLFGNEDPLGRILPVAENPDRTGPPPERQVVGVLREYRRRGEHLRAMPTVFTLHDFTDADEPAPRTCLIRVRPGTPASAEREILEMVRRMAPDMECHLERLETVRSRALREAFIPIAGLGVVAGFLVLMVGLGLIGVLWQRVARRRQEIGLRRALGATAGGVQRLILGELLALTTIAMALGSLIYLQFPLLGIVDTSWKAAILALVASVAVMMGFVLLCGLHPSRLATRIEPAEALLYE